MDKKPYAKKNRPALAVKTRPKMPQGSKDVSRKTFPNSNGSNWMLRVLSL
jgi:hypothetical protein